jgi:DNA ligase-1
MNLNITIENGYEGSMIRLDLSDYEGKRTKQLLKYKDWIDDEFEVIGFTEGKGQKSGMVGNVILRLKDGQECNSNMDGTFEFSKYVFEHQDEFIGKLATVKFQNYTPDKKLRCPYVKSFNRESYE